MSEQTNINMDALQIMFEADMVTPNMPLDRIAKLRCTHGYSDLYLHGAWLGYKLMAIRAKFSGVPTK